MEQKQNPLSQDIAKQQTKSGGVTQDKQQPPKQPSAQPLNTKTNDLPASPNPANAEIQSKPTVETNTESKSDTTAKDNTSKRTELETETDDLVAKVTKGLQEKSPLQNEKNLPVANPELLKALNEAKEYKSAPQQPTPGRIVNFYFDETDGICSNRTISSLPAIVVVANEFIASLSVFTLDSRDPIVLRKEIPHISVANKNSENEVMKPYWNWPVINK